MKATSSTVTDLLLICIFVLLVGHCCTSGDGDEAAPYLPNSTAAYSQQPLVEGVGTTLPPLLLDSRLRSEFTDFDFDGSIRLRFTEDAGRLPADVIPVHYNLTLAPFLYDEDPREFYFTGSVFISVVVRKSTSCFKLHTTMLNITLPIKVVDNNDGRSLAVESVEEDAVRQWHIVILSEQLLAGNRYTIGIDRFQGPLRMDRKGVYLASYVENGTARYLLTSQLQAVDARKVFPCFDEPAFKATFDVSIVRRSDFKAISNMPSKAVTDVPAADWFNDTTTLLSVVREDFGTTPIMSTYLLAFVVSELDHVSATDSKGREFRNWVRPKYVGATDYALKAAMNMIDFFETYFDVAYPLNKTDQALIVGRYGAMENWGLIIYGERDLVLNQKVDSASHLQNIDYLVSHELSHMWFGNLVTMTWWNELWLNEGFATFASRIGIHFLHPQCEMDSQFVIGEQAIAFLVDSSARSHPVYIDVASADQINTIFDQITYSKGATVLRMMYSFLGDDTFRIGVRNYLKSNSYKNTLNTAIYESLTRQAAANGNNVDVGEVMDRWINQMGYPVVHCRKSDENLGLRQEHFLDDPNRSPNPEYPSPYDFTWIIPITMVTMENASDWDGSEVSHLVQWMRTREQMFSINTSSWYLLNLRSTGFYRVNYDNANWDALIEQLLARHTVFTPQDRVRLLDDSFALASAGYLDISVPLRLAEYLKYERHYAPWKVALSHLQSTYKYGIPPSRLESELFSAYVRAVIGPVYESVGMGAAPGTTADSHLTRLTRGLVSKAACDNGLRRCQQDARTLFERFVQSNFTSDVLPPDSRPTVLCRGIAESSYEVQQRIRGLIGTYSSTNFDSDLMLAMSCDRRGSGRRGRRAVAADLGLNDDGGGGKKAKGRSRVVLRLRESLARMSRVD